MKFHFENDWKKEVFCLRGFSIIPDFYLSFYKNWKFESVRFSWLGFVVGIYS